MFSLIERIRLHFASIRLHRKTRQVFEKLHRQGQSFNDPEVEQLLVTPDGVRSVLRYIELKAASMGDAKRKATLHVLCREMLFLMEEHRHHVEAETLASSTAA